LAKFKEETQRNKQAGFFPDENFRFYFAHFLVIFIENAFHLNWNTHKENSWKGLNENSSHPLRHFVC